MGIVATIAALYFGRDIFLPLATAVLLTFALAPLVRPYEAANSTASRGGDRRNWSLRRNSPVRDDSGSQLGSLAENLPLYQRNIETKMQSIKDANLGEGSTSASPGCLKGLATRSRKTNPLRRVMRSHPTNRPPPLRSP